SQHQLQAERHRLASLRHKLKRRWHRHWAAERMAMRRRETAVAAARQQLQAKMQEVEKTEAHVAQRRIRFNTEAELGRRHLRADRDHLRQRRDELHQLARTLSRREKVVVELEQELAEQQRRLEAARADQDQEVIGLESRIENYRGKLLVL